MHTTALDEEPSNTEESPLLPKAQRSNAQQGDAKDIVQNDDVVEEISPRKLIWIMTSVWIGTFCAGLGQYAKPLRTALGVRVAVCSRFGLLICNRRIAHCHHRVINCHGVPFSATSRVARNRIFDCNCGNSAVGRKADRYLFPAQWTPAL